MLRSPLCAYRVSVTVRARSYGSAARRPDSHRVANVRERAGRDRAGLLGPGGERGLDRALVGTQQLVALPNGREVLDDRVGDGALEVSISRALELALDVLGRHV